MGATLIRHVETRWLSRFKAIKRFLSLDTRQRELIYDELSGARFQNNYLYRDPLRNIFDNLGALQSYVDLIEPVEVAVSRLQVYLSKHIFVITGQLQSDSEPTVNIVLIEYSKLCKHFEDISLEDDDEFQNEARKTMAESGLLVLKYQMSLDTTISDIHVLGLLLDPLNKDSIEEVSNYSALEVRFLFKNFVRNYCLGHDNAKALCQKCKFVHYS